MKYTKNDYFAAASAHDLWGFLFESCTPFAGKNVVQECGASLDCYIALLDEAEGPFGGKFTLGKFPNKSYVAAQLGCEKAGL